MQKSERDLLVVGNLAKDIISGKEYFGGSAANIAVNAAKLGLNVGILSVLGRDSFSQTYREFLQSKDIDVSLIENCLDELPTCQIISTENSNNNSIWTDNGCHPAMEGIEIEVDQVKPYKLTHLVSSPPKLSSRLSLLGLPISYEPGPLIEFDPHYLDLQVIRRAGLVFFNEQEYIKALALANFNSEADFRMGLLPKTLIVTRGDKEITATYLDWQSSQQYSQRPPFVKSVVNPTGAGDAFKASFFAGQLANLDLPQCLSLASHAGALAVQQEGGILLPAHIEEIRNHLAKYKSK